MKIVSGEEMKGRGLAALLAGAAVCSCGGDGGSGGGTPAPTPVASPTPSPSPTAAAYPTYAQLSGDQTFKTQCTALRFDAVPPRAEPALPFGQGLTLSYAAATQTYTLAPDAIAANAFGPQPRSFGPVDRDPAAPPTSTSYAKTTNGFQERFSIGSPSVAGTTPDYIRGFTLRASLGGNATPQGPSLQYWCLFGVPTRLDDQPRATQVVFTRTGFNGIAYVQPATGALETYALTPSQVSFSVDLVSYRVTATVRVIGNLLGAGGPSSAATELGTVTATIGINEEGFFNGLLNTPAGTNPTGLSTFGGWFFGPQGAEAGFVTSLMWQDPATGRRIVATGNAVALR